MDPTPPTGKQFPGGKKLPTYATSGKQLPPTMSSGKQLPPAMISSGKQLPPPAISSGKQLPPPAISSGKQLPPPAISTGKQFPPQPVLSPSTSPTASLVAQPSKDLWRLRKAADDFIESHQNIASAEDSDTLHYDFNVTSALSEVDPQVVRSALNVAAQCLLSSLQKPSAEDETESDTTLKSFMSNLPSQIDRPAKIAKLRHESLERAHNNKEYAKRPRLAEPKEDKKSDDPPRKFSRNTPASSASALDARVSSSRATICAAADLVFGQLTPGPEIVENNKTNEAQRIGDRVVDVVRSSNMRSRLGYAFRRKIAQQSSLRVDDSWTDSELEEDPMELDSQGDGLTPAWKEVCLPRLRGILEKGCGHALLLDRGWNTRHERIVDILQNVGDGRYGPHLIVTTEPNRSSFVQQLGPVPSKWQRLLAAESTQTRNSLSCLNYAGSATEKSQLRTKYFAEANGLPNAAFHVVVVSYSDFLEDFLHFSQIPWQMAILDDGAEGWMATAQQDGNSGVGQVWKALFTSSDIKLGLCASHKDGGSNWNFSSLTVSDAVAREACIGLTARRRLLVAPVTKEPISVPGLVEFLIPQFIETVKEDWDRSRIATDEESAKHLGSLASRATVVHDATIEAETAPKTCLLALRGQLPIENADPELSAQAVPEILQDGVFVAQNKVAFARRAALQCLGAPHLSWIRYELGKVELSPILDAINVAHHGFRCHEVTTASSTTSSGATGQVAGTLAFRPAVCCNRSFGSEQGLRLHVAGSHAPPGTWLCRTCGDDCVTSQARTFHERSCGQAASGSAGGEQSSTGGATATVGQGASKNSGKKRAPRAPQPSSGDQDTDGSVQVSEFEGVWESKSGKYFVKLNGERYKVGKDLFYFDNLDAAAKRYDELLCLTRDRNDPEIRLNFAKDGSRIIHTTPAPAAMGGSSSNVVPALSVINIKDLPPDVKPLLRDPRQTSRTGGNSKRHVYAYRGVCRQARKGHDRWQSQISFMGVNHYLGTFDSEWDAAAIYAWAHLILYGEEATRAAQKEGEEAAAAFEQEKKDIASGKIAAAPAKPEKKKRTPKKDKTSSEAAIKKKKPTGSKEADEKKTKTPSKVEKDSAVASSKGATSKAPVLTLRKTFVDQNDDDMLLAISQNVSSAAAIAYFETGLQHTYSALHPSTRPCVQDLSSEGLSCVGGAMFVGISPEDFGWDLKHFVESASPLPEEEKATALQTLAVEYDNDGQNGKFRSVVQGTVCTIGTASQRTLDAYNTLGLGTIPLGGSVGLIDCHIGANPSSCSQRAACITYSLEGKKGSYVLSCLSASDVVSVNGMLITGSQPLMRNDVCSVGPRVFTVLLPED